MASGEKVVEKLLIGEFSHSIDDKGRMIFPAKLREALGEKFVLAKGLDGCLFVYSSEEWDALAQKVKQMPMSKARNIQRFLFAGACEVEPDKQGRILIAANLREFANLSKDAVVVGASNRAEIWDKEQWETICGELQSDSIAELMDELEF